MTSNIQTVAPSQSSDAAPTASFFKLPIGIRQQIYSYVSLSETTWIGNDPAINQDSPQGVEPGPSAFVKTTCSLALTCHQTATEYRDLVWWRWLHKLHPNDYIDFRVCDFAIKPVQLFLASCSHDEKAALTRTRRDWHTQLRVRLTLDRVFTRWFSLLQLGYPSLILASSLFTGNLLVLLVHKLRLPVVSPESLDELREILKLSGGRDAQAALDSYKQRKLAEPVQKWVAFVQRVGLVAEYEVDSKTTRTQWLMWREVLDPVIPWPIRSPWRDLYRAVRRSVPGPSQVRTSTSGVNFQDVG
jgi:hypothetical protein